MKLNIIQTMDIGYSGKDADFIELMQELAETIGVSYKKLDSWLYGDEDIPWEYLNAIMEEYDIDSDDISWFTEDFDEEGVFCPY